MSHHTRPNPGLAHNPAHAVLLAAAPELFDACLEALAWFATKTGSSTIEQRHGSEAAAVCKTLIAALTTAGLSPVKTDDQRTLFTLPNAPNQKREAHHGD